MGARGYLTVRNAIFLSYILLFTVSLLGLILGSVNYGYGPVAQPPEPVRLNSSNDFPPDSKEYRRYMEYVEETRNYGTYELVPGFYVILPCGVGMVFAGTFVVLEFLLRDLTKTTVGLYSSLGLLSIVLGLTGSYQHQSKYLPRGYGRFLLSYGWVTTLHSLLLALLLTQIILSIWALCKQKVRWPTIHFSQFVTIGMVIRAVLVILNTVLIVDFLITTVHGCWSGYDEPVIRFPEYLFMPFAVSSLYTLLVSFEAFTSQIFGQVHNKMMGVNGFIMILAYGILITISAPSSSDQFLSNPNRLEIALIFSSVCLCITLIYTALCVKFPTALNTPPAIIRYLAHGLANMKFIGDKAESGGCCYRCTRMGKGIAAFCRLLRTSETLRANLMLTILSFVCVVLLSVSWNYNASCVVMLCTDIAILYRSLSALMTQLSTGIPPETQTFQAVFQFFLESFPLFIAVILTFFTTHNPLHISGSVLNIIIMIFQLYKLHTNPVKAQVNAALEEKARSAAGGGPSDEEQPVMEDGKEESPSDGH